MSDLTVKEIDMSFYAALLECTAVYEVMEGTHQKELMSIGMANTPFPSSTLRLLAHQLISPITLCDTVIKQFTELKEYIIKKKAEMDTKDIPLSPDPGLN